MPKTLAEILADAAAGDDLAFTGPDGITFKLADLRGFKKSVDGETAAAKAKREEAEATAMEAAKILDVLKKAKDEMNANPGDKNKDKDTNKGDDWKKDALYAPLVPVFEALEKQAKQSFELATALQKELARSSSFYMIERMRSEYNSAPESFRKATPFEKAVQAALSNQEFDAFGEGENVVKMPTLRRRIHEGTEAERIAAAVKEGVETEKKKWEEKQRLDSLPKPGKFQTRTKTDKPPIEKLEQLTSDVVANDPDILKAMEGPTV